LPYTYPVGNKGTIIGTPHAGTHNQKDWQSANAIDIKVPAGTPVYAAEAGVVNSLDVHPAKVVTTPTGKRLAGTGVGIAGSDNSFFYAHLKDVTVKPGDHVAAGQIIGYTGVLDHLHFAVKNGRPGDVIRGAAMQSAPAETAAPTASVMPEPTGAIPGVVAPTPTAPPTAPQPTGPAVPAPGSQNFSLDHSAAFATWQQVAQLDNLSPDTQRMLQIAGGLGAA
jgi:murein DD-endopeptidase MepM/ murein hydrolase activator NlpD